MAKSILKDSEIESIAKAMLPAVLKLAKANMRCTGKMRRMMGATKLEKKTLIESSVEAAMDAYEPDRVLLDVSDPVIQRLFKLADAELSREVQ